jgi:hypothetical protein
MVFKIYYAPLKRVLGRDFLVLSFDLVRYCVRLKEFLNAGSLFGFTGSLGIYYGRGDFGVVAEKASNQGFCRKN